MESRSVRRNLVLGAVVALIVLPLLGPLLIRTDLPASADAIVVIGGDHKPDRIQRAVELYEAGYARLVILSAGNVVAEGGEHLPEAEVMRRQALSQGLPETALLVEAGSFSTFQNAYCTQAIALERGFKSILLVTSAHQSRRASRIFGDVYGETVEILVQPAASGGCALCWWFQPDSFGVVAYEYYNWGRYWLGIRLPSEAAPNSACHPLTTAPLAIR